MCENWALSGCWFRGGKRISTGRGRKAGRALLGGWDPASLSHPYAGQNTGARHPERT